MQHADPPGFRPLPSTAKRARLLSSLRWLVPIALLALLLRLVPLDQVIASARLIPASALVEAVAVIVIATVLATLRWRILFAGCGLPAKPRFLELLRTYWIGTFYNAYVPGGVGGDVLRGFATRRMVGPGGLPTALAIVLLERVLGLVGMLLLLSSALLLFPLEITPAMAVGGAVCALLAAAAVFVIARGLPIARYLPARFASLSSSLPRVTSKPLLSAALGLSVVTQLSGVVVGHLLISSITPKVRWSDSLFILPLANASQYFPFALGGAGVRDASFVVLYGAIGVSNAHALAASMTFAAIQYALSATGGLLHAIRPIDLE
jgi:uncharacterized membrane protein YbhN (UPF0104 family)